LRGRTNRQERFVALEGACGSHECNASTIDGRFIQGPVR
jgi:hypothetical protein